MEKDAEVSSKIFTVPNISVPNPLSVLLINQPCINMTKGSAILLSVLYDKKIL